MIITFRNYSIVTDMQNNIAKYNDSTNYYIKSIAKEDNGTTITMEYYKKDNKQAVFLERNIKRI